MNRDDAITAATNGTDLTLGQRVTLLVHRWKVAHAIPTRIQGTVQQIEACQEADGWLVRAHVLLDGWRQESALVVLMDAGRVLDVAKGSYKLVII